MRLRPHRRNLVVWSSSVGPADKAGGLRSGGLRSGGLRSGGLRSGGLGSTRPARARRIRWRLRTGALLMVLGVLRLARTARARWEPVSLIAGALVTLAGLMLSAAGAFFAGLLIFIVTLLKGIKEQRERDPAGS